MYLCDSLLLACFHCFGPLRKIQCNTCRKYSFMAFVFKYGQGNVKVVSLAEPFR
eukprot:m.115277 g.115277  ORF g.115277 m.115277 type:complete len:54 (-) comp14196_c0_seq1:1100-1261(-)